MYGKYAVVGGQLNIDYAIWSLVFKSHTNFSSLAFSYNIFSIWKVCWNFYQYGFCGRERKQRGEKKIGLQS